MLEHLVALFTPFVIKFGLTCMAAQCVLYVCFKRLLPKGPWREDPGFTAHQVVCIPLMVFLSYHGWREWFSKEDHGYDPVHRILGPHPKPDLSAVVMAMQFFWDIPTGLCTPSLRNPAMVLHHVAMFATAILALGAWSQGHALLGFYAAYYFGVIELSSIPLIFVDLFHPKHKAWYDYYKTGPGWLKVANEVNRVVFAVLFIIVRAISFPYVSFLHVIPDILHVASLSLEERNNVSVFALYQMAGLNLIFSCLQFYWGTLVLRQIIKTLSGSMKRKTK